MARGRRGSASRRQCGLVCAGRLKGLGVDEDDTVSSDIERKRVEVEGDIVFRQHSS